MGILDVANALTFSLASSDPAIYNGLSLLTVIAVSIIFIITVVHTVVVADQDSDPQEMFLFVFGIISIVAVFIMLVIPAIIGGIFRLIRIAGAGFSSLATLDITPYSYAFWLIFTSCLLAFSIITAGKYKPIKASTGGGSNTGGTGGGGTTPDDPTQPNRHTRDDPTPPTPPPPSNNTSKVNCSTNPFMYVMANAFIAIFSLILFVMLLGLYSQVKGAYNASTSALTSTSTFSSSSGLFTL